MILIIDNYDSFTYNLVQVVGSLGFKLVVFRNNKITINEIKTLNPEKIIISPGPCTPKESGISNNVIREFMYTKPILGVCLGHQCIGYVFGARIIHAQKVMHGKTSEIYHDGKAIYENVSNPFTAMRYNSLLVDPQTLDSNLIISSKSKMGEIMGIRHKNLPLEGVQFHPESYRTSEGLKMLENFLKRVTLPS